MEKHEKIWDAPDPQYSNVLIMGNRNRRVQRLVRILSEYFNQVYRISDLSEMANLPSADPFCVIVVTDSIERPLNRAFFSDLRAYYPDARLVCVVDRITREMEIAMRSAGLLFLGSYNHFSKYCHDILQSAKKSKEMDSC